MDRYLSDPLPLSDAVRGAEFSGADLIFYDVDHSGESFQARVFLNAPDAGPETPLEPAAGFAGTFVIFGHGGCFGGEGHCEVPTSQKDPFDSRPLHPLTPQTKLVDVGEALKRAAAEGDHLTVTVVPVVPSEDGPEQRDLLFFSSMRLVAYD
jgi:hypothetical protein